MDKYIKIQKNTFPTFYKRNLNDYGKGWNACLNSVLQHTTANVVEVVRCKDCKHWGGVIFGNICRRFSGTYIRNETRENDFCSFGERKDV